MIRLPFFLFLASVSAFNWTKPDLGRDCGSGETGSPGIKYYVDRDSNEVLPFFYRGCGGDDNRYDSQSAAPVLMDANHCPGYPITAGDCNTGKYPWNQPQVCPSTAYCQEYWPFNGNGICCDSGAAARVAENWEAPQCAASGLPVIKEETWYGEKTLLGRNCTHNFCPEGSVCYQGEFYAYCCEKKDEAYNWTQPDLGRDCQSGEAGETPGIRYYVDRGTNQVLPFFYRGCGGDGNRYESRTHAPMLMDYASCPGYPAPIGDGCTTGTRMYPWSQPKKCPETAYCRPSNPWNDHGMCCDAGAAEREAINRQAPECKAAGLSVVMEERSWGAVHLLGRSCTHYFCPQGSSCRQGEFYAYCCR